MFFLIYKTFTKLLSLFLKFLILLFLRKLQPVAILFLTNGIRLIKEAYYKRTNCGFIHYDIERVSKERYVTCSRHAITYRPQRYLYMISYQRYAYIWVFLLSSNDIPMVVFMSLNVISLRWRQRNKTKLTYAPLLHQFRNKIVYLFE